MARRGRHRRVGLKRIDAAIDALTPMGFSPELIRRSVDKLLKEYGEEGWPFIEEAAYKLLIEFILEEKEEAACEQGEPSFRDSPNEDRHQGGGEDEPSEAGPSTEASEPLCSSQFAALTTDTPLASPVPLVVHKPSLTPAENVTIQSKTATSNEVNWTNDILISQEKIAGFSSIYMFPGPPGFEHTLQEKIAHSKRKPCLGWIGSKDNEDFVLLEPAPVLGWRTGERRRKRKSRWDVGPVGPYDVV